MVELGVGLGIAVRGVGDSFAFDRIEQGFHERFPVVGAPAGEIALEKRDGFVGDQGRAQAAAQRGRPRSDA